MDTKTAGGPARIAGMVGLVGGLIAVAVCVYELATLPTEVSTATGVRNAVLQATAVVALVGLAALGATGPGRWGRIGIGVAILGFALLITGELVEQLDPATATTIFEIAPFLLGPGLLLAGVAVLRAGRWSGWRRFFPLVNGIYAFVYVAVVIAVDTDAGFWIAILPWDLGLAVLGLAVAVEASAPVDARARSRIA